VPRAPDSPAPAARTVLSFDYGLRRIGVAVGNTLTGTADALTTVAASDGMPDWTAVDRLVADWRPAALVAGVPYNEGGDGRLAAAALRFAGELGLRELRRSGAKAKRVRRGDVDREAARLLLLQWLRGTGGSPGP
jgi:putative Holliday junction resolvase